MERETSTPVENPQDTTPDGRRIVRPQLADPDTMEKAPDPIPENEVIKVDDPVQILDDSKNEMTNKLRQLDMAAPSQFVQEDFTMFFSGTNFMQKISDFITSFAEQVTAVVSDLAEKVFNVTNTKYDLSMFETHIKQVAYFDISKKFKLNTPSKLKGRWLPYSEWLIEFANLVSGVDKDVVFPLSEYFAKAINKPDILTSSTFKPNYTSKDLDAYQKTLQHFFSGTNRTYVLWGEAFAKNEDAIACIKNLEKAREIANTVSPEALKKAVTTLAERAKIIANSFKDKSGKHALNPKQSKYFSDVLFDAARHVEFYSVAHQLIYELEQCFVFAQSSMVHKMK